MSKVREPRKAAAGPNMLCAALTVSLAAALPARAAEGAPPAPEVTTLLAGDAVVSMCTWLAVSTSGFYVDHRHPRRPGRRALVTLHVRAAFDAGRGAYGARRVHAVLTRCDDPSIASVSLQFVCSVMRENDLVACQPRAYKVTTEHDGNAEPAIADHLRRDFTAEAPGAKLVGDITYIRTWTGWLYLAT